MTAPRAGCYWTDCAANAIITVLMKDKFDTIIIGGGAAGMYLAAMLAESGRGEGTLLIERNARLGKKLSATGNGQGNVGNEDMDIRHYSGGAARYKDIIAADVLSFLGGIFAADERGRIYPASKQASSVTDELRRKIERGGVTVLLDTMVTAVTKKDGEFTVSCGQTFRARNVVLACGGKAQKQFGTDGSGYALATGFGHKLTPLYPSLVQLKTDTQPIKTLKGIRTDCRLTARAGGKVLKRADGEIIFADYGVTGSAVFDISPCLAGMGGVTLDIELLPAVSYERLLSGIKQRRAEGREDEELLALALHNQLARAVVKASDGSDEGIARTVKCFSLAVTGSLGFDYAQVTRGGIDLAGITDGLESKLCPGLYFAGEVLDIDGECGGYNLHWAFAGAKKVFEEITK